MNAKHDLAEALCQLLETKTLEKITVKDIVARCGVNRQTFYYHFQDIPSLIEEIVMEEIDTLIAKYPTISSLDECVNLAFRFAIENKKAVLHIYNSINRDIYESYIMKLCEYVVSTYLDTAFGKNAVSEKDHAIAVRFFKCELFGLTFDWIANGMKEEAIEEIHHVTELCRGMSDEIIKRSKEHT